MKKKKKLFFATLFIIAVLATSLCYNVNTSNAGDTPTKKCQYKYTDEFYKGKSCPYDALPGSNFCIWHEKKDKKNFKGKRIKDTDLVEAYLEGADLEDAVFSKGTNLSYANLQGAYMWHTNLEGANLTNANLEGAHLGGAHLEKADLSGAHLEKADLTNAHLEGTDLRNANLQGVVLMYANLQGADLRNKQLLGVNLSSVNLQGANLYNVNFEGAELNNADLRASFLFASNLKGAKGLQYAVLGNRCMEEIIADVSDKFNNYHNFEEIPTRILLAPELQKIGLTEKDISSFIPKSVVGYYDPMEYSFTKFIAVCYTNYYGTRLTLYKHSRDVYIELKNYFKDAGYYVKSGQFFISEYRVRGKIYELTGEEYAAALSGKIKQFFNRIFHRGGSAQEPVPAPQGESNVFVLLKRMLGNYFAFFVNKLLFATSEYGESVSRVLFTAIVIIFIYAGIYSIKGSAVESNAKPEARKPIHNFWTNLYFSIVTFTTLGYGDLRPIPSTGIRLLAGSEAFLGAFTIAYFVVVVSRKIMR